MHILLIENDPHNTAIAWRVLSSHNTHISLATNLSEAFVALHRTKQQPDLVICNWFFFDVGGGYDCGIYDNRFQRSIEDLPNDWKEQFIENRKASRNNAMCTTTGHIISRNKNIALQSIEQIAPHFGIHYTPGNYSSNRIGVPYGMLIHAACKKLNIRFMFVTNIPHGSEEIGLGLFASGLIGELIAKEIIHYYNNRFCNKILKHGVYLLCISPNGIIYTGEKRDCRGYEKLREWYKT